MPTRFFYGSLIAIAAVLLVIDQAAKSWAESNLQVGEAVAFWGPLQLALVYNHALAFGASFISGSGIIALVFISTLFFLVMIFWLPHNRYTLLAGGLLFGGGASNSLDRISGSGVVDYLYFGEGSPVFNLADVFLTAGLVVIIFYIFRRAFRDMNYQEA